MHLAKRDAYDQPVRFPCSVPFRAGADACTILSRFPKIIFFGDSLTRQLFETLVALLRDDMRYGTFDELNYQNRTRHAACGCRGSIGSEECGKLVVSFQGMRRPLPDGNTMHGPAAVWRGRATVCGVHLVMLHTYEQTDQSAEYSVKLLEAELQATPGAFLYLGLAPFHPMMHTPEAAGAGGVLHLTGSVQPEVAAPLLQAIASFLLAEHGARPRLRLDSPFALLHWLGPIGEVLRRVRADGGRGPSGAAYARTVYAPLHWVEDFRIHGNSPLKPYTSAHEHIWAYNRATSSYAHSIGMPVFDTRSLTRDVGSYDGVHHSYATNVLKAQLLLHHMLSLE